MFFKKKNLPSKYFLSFSFFFDFFLFLFSTNKCFRGGKKRKRKKKREMHLFFFALSLIILATSVAYAAATDLQSAQHVLGFMANSASLVLERRQVTECARVPAGALFCERSCGPLFTACVIATNCYLPSLGQTCCANAGN